MKRLLFLSERHTLYIGKHLLKDFMQETVLHIQYTLLRHYIRIYQKQCTLVRSYFSLIKIRSFISPPFSDMFHIMILALGFSSISEFLR